MTMKVLDPDERKGVICSRTLEQSIGQVVLPEALQDNYPQARKPEHRHARKEH